MKPDICIRVMENADVDRYSLLFQKVFAAPPWNEQWDSAVVRASLLNKMDSGRFLGLAACRGAETVGYLTGSTIIFLPSFFYLEQLFVIPEYRGKGIGAGLITAMKGHCTRKRTSFIVLLTRPSSVAASFYRRRGYRRVAPFLLIRGKGIFYTGISRFNATHESCGIL